MSKIPKLRRYHVAYHYKMSSKMHGFGSTTVEQPETDTFSRANVAYLIAEQNNYHPKSVVIISFQELQDHER